MQPEKLTSLSLHFTRWVFYTGERQLPRYVQPQPQPFFVVSVFERSGPEFTRHMLVCLN